MNKSDFVAIVADEMGCTKAEAARAVESVFVCVKKTLKNKEELRLMGFGTFKVSDVPAKTVRNPQNGQPINVPASRRAKFVPGKDLKAAVNS